MSLPLDTIPVQMFSTEFLNTIQAFEKLGGITREIHELVGDSYKLKLADTADMHTRGGYQTDVTPTEITYSAPSISFENYILNILSDEFEQLLVNANERSNLVSVHTKALGRRNDQVTIDALIASGTTKTIADAGANLTVLKLTETAEKMDEDEVSEEDRHIIIHASSLRSLLNQEKATSTDYASIKALVRGDINSFMGFNFHTIGNRAIGGLPKTGNIRTLFAFQKDVVYKGYRKDPTVTIDWNPEKQSYMTISKMSLGAVVSDAKGVVEIDCDESV